MDSRRLELASREKLLAGDCAEGWRLLTAGFAADPQGLAAQYGEATEQAPLAPSSEAAEAQIPTQKLIAALDRVVAGVPDLACAWAWRGALRRRLHLYADAVSDLDRAWALGARSAALLTWRGEALLQVFETARGLRDLRAALKRPDAAAWNWAWCGRITITLLQDRKGLRCLDRALKLDGRWAVGWAWRGEARRHAGDGLGSDRDFEKALKLGLDDYWTSMVMGWRGLGLLGRGKTAEARRALLAVRARMPHYALWPHGLSRAAREAGDLRAWVEFLDEAARLGPKHVFAVRNQPEEQARAAAADLDRVLAEHPALPAALRWRGLVRLRLDDGAGAAEDLAAACRLEPGNASAWLWNAQAQARVGRFDEAASSVGRCLALDPLSVEALLTAARVEAARGAAEKALAAYARAEAADPRCTLVYSERGCLLLTLGDARRALSDLERAVTLDKRDAERFVDLAEAQRRSGDAARAAKTLREASRLDRARASSRRAQWKALAQATA